MSKEYLVTWKIDIDADSPKEAAQKALMIQRDNESEATYFEIKDKKTKKVTKIDLEEQDQFICPEEFLED